MAVEVVLLLAGLLALGLPKVRHRDRQRFWHPWVNEGLLPLLVGLVIARFVQESLTEPLRPLLAAALTAGGVLVGTQLRAAYLLQAGGQFIRRQTISACSAGLTVALISVPVMLLFFDGYSVSIEMMAAAPLVIATSQRPPSGGGDFDVKQRDIVTGHVAPAGWWNLLALGLGGILFSLPPLTDGGLLADWSLAVRLPAAILLPVGLGVFLGWCSSRSRNRDEAYLFLLAVIAVGTGGALLFGVAPLLTGILIGAAFNNMSLGRSPLVEQAVEELEQPVAISAGLIAGLIVADLDLLHLTWPVWAGLSLVLVGRWLVRGIWSPTSSTLAGRNERRLASPGATGVLLVAGVALLPGCHQAMLLPLVCVLVIWTLLAEIAHLRRN